MDGGRRANRRPATEGGLILNGARRRTAVLKMALVYVAFGVAHEVVEVFYCAYRATIGNPSDLPCVSLLWNSIGVLGWPLMAADEAVTGQAVLLPTLLVRATGTVFLAGFVVTLVWAIRNLSRTSPR